MKTTTYIKIALLATILLSTFGCEEDTENSGNHLPTVSIIDKKQTINAGETATVEAQAIDMDGDSLTYLWKIKEKPNGSEAQLVNQRTKTVSLITDKGGNYTLSFVANDGLSDSKIVTAIVQASSPDPVVPDDKEDSDRESNVESGDKNSTENPNTHDNVSSDMIKGTWYLDANSTHSKNKDIPEDRVSELLVMLIFSTAEHKDDSIIFNEDKSAIIFGNNEGDRWEYSDNSFTLTEKDKTEKILIRIEDKFLIMYKKYKGMFGEQEEVTIKIFFQREQTIEGISSKKIKKGKL